MPYVSCSRGRRRPGKGDLTEMTKPNIFERPDPDRVPTHVDLPELAYVVHPEGELVIVKRGERGYYPYGPKSDFNTTVAASLNQRMGVTPTQAEAMAWGSMFGWHTPGADPANYDADGRLRGKAS